MSHFKSSKRGELAYYTKKINDLINDGKIKLAQKLVDELMIKSPDDDILRCESARLKIFERRYSEALEDIENVNEVKCFKKKTVLNIKLKQEDEVYRLYKTYFCDSDVCFKYTACGDRTFYWLKCYLDAKYNPNFHNGNFKSTYMVRQISNYNEDEAIKHITIRHDPRFSDNGKLSTLFSKDFNIHNIFHRIRNTISTNLDKAVLKSDFEDCYHFEVPNCSDDSCFNYIEVICIINTDKIITMYPSKKHEDVPIFKINNEENINNVKVKTRSGLERFNSRYCK